MIKKDEGIIIFSKKIKDNDLFIKVLSSKDKIVSGMVYGGNSAKKKIYIPNRKFYRLFFISKKYKYSFNLCG